MSGTLVLKRDLVGHAALGISHQTGSKRTNFPFDGLKITGRLIRRMKLRAKSRVIRHGAKPQLSSIKRLCVLYNLCNLLPPMMIQLVEVRAVSTYST